MKFRGGPAHIGGSVPSNETAAIAPKPHNHSSVMLARNRAGRIPNADMQRLASAKLSMMATAPSLIAKISPKPLKAGSGQKAPLNARTLTTPVATITATKP